MAARAGFAVTIVDPRRAWATAGRFPDQTLVTEWPDAALETLAPDARTAVVTLTHDPKLDDPALVVALRSPAFYIGCLGSRKTHAARRERLAAAGCSGIDRLRGPVGLAIRRAQPGGDRDRDPCRDHRDLARGGMKLGPVPVAEAAGAVLVHTLRAAVGCSRRATCWSPPTSRCWLRAVMPRSCARGSSPASSARTPRPRRSPRRWWGRTSRSTSLGLAARTCERRRPAS